MPLNVRVWITVLCLVMPAAAWAQQNGSIAGLVTDGSGGVLPGATVEVSSPALIERTRSTVTDGTGQYRVVDLRPVSTSRRTSAAAPDTTSPSRPFTAARPWISR